MTLGIFEAMEPLAVEPITVGFVWLQFYLNHAGLMVGLIMRCADPLRTGVVPGCGPGPGLVRHLFAEGYFELRHPGSHIRDACLRNGFHDYRGDGLYVLRVRQCRREAR